MHLKTQSELNAIGLSRLPSTLGQALDAFEADPLSVAVMRKEMASAWLDYKLAEWRAYYVHVIDWEKQRCLKMI